MVKGLDELVDIAVERGNLGICFLLGDFSIGNNI